jgi:hypothetical protein
MIPHIQTKLISSTQILKLGSLGASYKFLFTNGMISTEICCFLSNCPLKNLAGLGGITV